ncbi:SRPBCC family protein [Halosimplex rubrum]|uniref:SRPBCC family protein n=1 Tax=Halosimplex rubrum TaxID=869889 RepID=A0A7D5T6T4_9EURY|nr:SRPBCC family protein [Halosimplex rubrum]QLH77915.1 SRPBCC family protein [Halosimplex rubrum]
MPVYEREVVVDAPFDEVWEFHSGASGLEALTPDWMNLRIESSVGPDGEPDPDVLEAGSRVESTVAPFGVAPRQRWVSAIVARAEGDGEAFFRDEMRQGPFPEWVHTHSFEAVDGGPESETSGTSSERRSDGGTRVHDHVEYELPVVRGLFGPLGWVGFEPMFRYRHRKTKELLE